MTWYNQTVQVARKAAFDYNKNYSACPVRPEQSNGLGLRSFLLEIVMTQYVYKIQAGEYIKIGIANDVQSRMAQLQTGNPYRLELMSCYGFDDASLVERALHQAYAKMRGVGEWFRLTAKQSEDFETICQMLGGEYATINGNVSAVEIEAAEDFEEEIFDGKRRGRPLANPDGWRLEFVFETDKIVRARLRRGSGDERRSNFINLGTIEDVYYGDNPEWKSRCIQYCQKTGYVIKGA
jgi:hypothetical protein